MTIRLKHYSDNILLFLFQIISKVMIYIPTNAINSHYIIFVGRQERQKQGEVVEFFVCMF